MDDMKCKELLDKIRELEFAAVDLTLYLDNHPTCEKALADYNTVVEELSELKKAYEMSYGPLVHFGCAPSQYPWRWVNEPWPWEIQEG